MLSHRFRSCFALTLEYSATFQAVLPEPSCSPFQGVMMQPLYLGSRWDVKQAVGFILRTVGACHVSWFARRRAVTSQSIQLKIITIHWSLRLRLDSLVR